MERNLDRTGLRARARVVRRDVAAFLAGGSGGLAEAPFGCVFVDPPYAQAGDLQASLERLGDPLAGWLDEAALVVAKHFWKVVLPDRVGDLGARPRATLRRDGPERVSSRQRDRCWRELMRLAVYPGSFDPTTFGHIDVIERASRQFDRLLVAVLVNTRKSPSRSADERAAILRAAIDEELAASSAAIEVVAFEGLTVDLARKRGATAIVRGLRALSDFENELAIAHLNRKLAPDVDTVFFMTGVEHAYLSSSLVREIAAFGGDISAMVPAAVVRSLGAVTQP